MDSIHRIRGERLHSGRASTPSNPPAIRNEDPWPRRPRTVPASEQREVGQALLKASDKLTYQERHSYQDPSRP